MLRIKWQGDGQGFIVTGGVPGGSGLHPCHSHEGQHGGSVNHGQGPTQAGSLLQPGFSPTTGTWAQGRGPLGISPWGAAARGYLTGCWPTSSSRRRVWAAVQPLSGSQGELDGVLEPKIESFDFSIPYLKTGAYTARSPTALLSTR